MAQTPTALGRRGFLVGAGALGAGAVLTACTSNSSDAADKTAATGNVKAAGTDNDKPGKAITIGFSAPQADHGWIGAITTNAKSQAAQYEDVTLDAVEGTNDVNQQISQVETLISKGVDIIVMLPFDGKALTETGIKAMEAGIPVVNLDRVFDSPQAARTWIGGDNYGMGAAAGRYVAEQMKAKGVSNPVIAEIQGIASLPLTQDRSQGFKDALSECGLDVDNRVAADFTVEGGEEAATNLLQAAPKIDFLWNHDDDQGVGVLAAIDNAGRDEFQMIGGAGSKNAMEAIQSGDSVLKATVIYPSTQAADGIKLARLLVQGKSMSDLVEVEVPRTVQLYAPVVTADNVDQFIDTAFTS